jgi:hypothetical protein
MNHPLDRGQTVIDFGIGAGIFVLTVALVFAFIPSLFEPFSSAASSSSIVADRTADHLTGSLLAVDPATPSVLSTACTAAFFGGNDTLSTAADCEFVASEPVDEQLGVGGRDVNVTVRNLGDSPSTGPAVQRTVDGTSYTLTKGTDGFRSDVSVASRVVLVDGDRYRLVVKVW